MAIVPTSSIRKTAPVDPWADPPSFAANSVPERCRKKAAKDENGETTLSEALFVGHRGFRQGSG